MTIHCPSGMFAFSKQLDRKGKTLILRQPVRPIRCYRANVALGWTEISSSEAALRGDGESTLAVSIRPVVAIEL